MVAVQPRRASQRLGIHRICDALDQKDEEEMKRLLYVACTRARNELYLFGSASKNRKSEP